MAYQEAKQARHREDCCMAADERTQSQRVLALLENAIGRGRLAPGERLDERELAEQFGVSRTPVREALHKLSVLGFVKIRPRVGAAVVKLDPDELMDQFVVMAALEGLCARLAARRMTRDGHDRLAELHDACGRDDARADPDLYYDRNVAFHEAIYEGAHNPYLAAETRRMRNRLSYYRRNQLHFGPRVATSHGEHGAIVAAIVSGDAEAAEALMRRHVNVQGDGVADMLATARRPANRRTA